MTPCRKSDSLSGITSMPLISLCILLMLWLLLPGAALNGLSLSEPSVYCSAMTFSGYSPNQSDSLRRGVGSQPGTHSTSTIAFHEARSALFDFVAQGREEMYGRATARFMDALYNFREDSLSLIALKEEAHLLKYLLSDEPSDQLSALISGDAAILAEEVRKIWTELDPLPAEPSNPRLLEHVDRIQKARELYPDRESDYLTDGRGVIYIRYGPPSRVLEDPLQFNRGEIQGFVTDFAINVEGSATTGRERALGVVNLSSQATALNRDADAILRMAQSSLEREAGQIALSRVTDELIETIYRNPFQTSLKIWIYHRFDPEMQNNLIFYFTPKGRETYREVETLDNWIPAALFQPSSRGYDANFSPALPLQYLAYRRLMFEDRTFLDRYAELDNRIFNTATERSTAELLQLSSNLRQRNEQVSRRIRRESPDIRSEELARIPTIPLDAVQYRSLNRDLEPIFITFIESYPLAPFLTDFGLNEDLFFEEDHDDPERVLNAISEWYSIEQGVELFDRNRVRKGRLRNNLKIYTDDEMELPSRMVADLPFIEEGALQSFYVTLKNSHPDVTETGTSFVGRDLRALGNRTGDQPAHALCNSETLCMSDLILGSVGSVWPDTRFPFLVHHNRELPKGKSPLIHMELFYLSSDDEGFSNFEIEYRFAPLTQRSRSLFRRQQEPVSGTLSFQGQGSQFRESLEFENLDLREGRYLLTWIVRDRISSEEIRTELPFEVVQSPY